MATMRTPGLWRDPRTGIWMLRRRIPTRHRPVADQKGETVKITTGTADRLEALRRWPEVLQQWAAMEAEWERRLVEEALTPGRALEIAARWAAWIAAGATLETGGEDSDVFEPLDLPASRTPEAIARMQSRLDFHAERP